MPTIALPDSFKNTNVNVNAQDLNILTRTYARTLIRIYVKYIITMVNTHLYYLNLLNSSIFYYNAG